MVMRHLLPGLLLLGVLCCTWQVGRADCSATGTFSGTAEYTPGEGPVTVTLDGTITCKNIPSNQYLCMKTVFSSIATSTSGAIMNYTVQEQVGNTMALTSMGTGNVYTTPITGNTVNYIVKITAPTDTSQYYALGTYNATDVKLYTQMAPQESACNMPTGPDAPVGGGGNTWSGTFAAAFTVKKACRVAGTEPADFGAFSDIKGGQMTDKGSVTVQCSPSVPYTIYLGDGLHYADGTRRMQNQSDTTSFLPYQLYKDNSHTPWNTTGGGNNTNDAAGGVKGTGTGDEQKISVYGEIPASTILPAAGNYKDTVVVTIVY